MIKHILNISMAVLALGVPGNTSSQIQNAEKDSLVNYLLLAGKNNPVVMQKYYEYQAALQRIPQAGSLPDPELSMGVFLEPMELIGGSQVATVRLMQMFPWFGTLKAARDEMSLMAQAKYEAFLDAKSQVYYDVQRTWYDLYRINNEIKISERNLQILKAIERIALVKYGSSSAGGSETSSGTALTDLYRIRIETGELENNIALLNDRKKTLTAVFNSYLDRNPATAVEIADTLLTDTLDISLLAVPDSILANNPMLSMLRYEEQSYNSREKMVSRMGLPMLGLGIDYSLIRPGEMSESPMNGKDMIMPMVSLTLPVYRKKYRSLKNETELLKESVAQNYSAMENSLQTEYFQALQMHEDARRRLKLYSDEYMLAKKSLDIILKSFSASGSSLTDVLRLQQQVLDYELKQSGAVADCNTSVAWLRRLTAVIKI